MNNKITILFLATVITILSSCFSFAYGQQKDKAQEKKTEKPKVVESKENATFTIIKKDSLAPEFPLTEQDSLELLFQNGVVKQIKKNAHASYYHNKFNGKRTASGKRFDNNKYTAAHKKLPFGTKVRVTNEANGKSVIVEITDRGPFSKVREIDLSRRAFMDITSNKNSGVVIVKLEIVN
ncbi:septal ring lytic transglycosylase RlpA family protein [Flavobacterium sp. RSB2_4_14]|uniref:septal ring lytic transglycosylase RlpA family protein n=1 Tax=Flavobacterium sp. RSB2_4_14 TaxID=3447665 RepID=UPI003F35E767